MYYVGCPFDNGSAAKPLRTNEFIIGDFVAFRHKRSRIADCGLRIAGRSIRNPKWSWLWLCVMLMVTATAWAEKPAWVLRGGSAEVSDARVMQGFGVAGATEDVERDWMRAKDGARAEIVRQIRVQIDAVVEDTLSERGGKMASATTMVTRSSVDMVLEGIQIAEQWYDAKEKVYYALAVLDRMEAGRRLTKQITEADRAAHAYWDGAETDCSEGRWVAALRGRFRAEEERSRALSLERIRSVVWKGGASDLEVGGPTAAPLSMAQMERTLGRMVSELKLSAASGDGQQMTWGAVLAEPLVAEAVWRSEDGERPVEGVSVRFGFERSSGTLDSLGVTDARGQAACNVHRVSGEMETARVVARVDTTVLGAEFTHPNTGRWLAQLAEVRTVFTLQRKLRRLFVAMDETVLGEATGEKMVESLLKERISQWGKVAIAEDRTSAEWILEGQAAVRAGQHTTGIHSCYATVTVRLFEVQSRTELFKKRLDGVKGFHIDQREAGRRALEKAGARIAKDVVSVLEGL